MLKFQVTSEICLKTFVIEDAAELFRVVDKNRLFLKKWLPWLDQNVRVEDSEDFIETTLQQYSDKLGFQCAILYCGDIVGTCGYHPIRQLNNSVTIGYWLSEHMNGKGIVTMCTNFLIKYAFNTLKVNKVCIQVAEENFKSMAVCERLGLVNEGIEREAENLYGNYANHIRYSLLKSEWSTRQESAR